MKRLFLVRHGESQGNVDNTVYDTVPDHKIDLTEKGIQDAKDAAQKIKELIGDKRFLSLYMDVYESPYRRAKRTSEVIRKELFEESEVFPANVYEHPLIRERHWGELRKILRSPAKNDQNYFNFFYRPNGGESLADANQRAVIFHQWMVNHHKNENVLVVSHGEFIKTYLMHILGWTLREFYKVKNPKNGQVYMVEFDDDLYRGGLSRNTPL